MSDRSIGGAGDQRASQKPDPHLRPGPGFATRGALGQRATSYSATTSRPWAVSAQITAMSTAMIAIDQTGYHGMNAKLAIGAERRHEHADGAGEHVAGHDPEPGEDQDRPEDEVDPSPLR